MTPLYIVLGIVLLIILWIIALYNGLVKSNTRCDEALSDIDVQTKRRYDLIPNLVETVKGYATHEKRVFEEVTKARVNAMSAKDLGEKSEAENMLSGTLKSLFAVAENYPDLKANVNFLELQKELSDTENKIEASRRFYNTNIRDFNIKIRVFPNNLLAGMLGFMGRPLFEAKEEERKAVQVDFGASQ